MAEEKYGITLATHPISLLRVPHKQGTLTVAYPVFSLECQGLMSNIDLMKRNYFHPLTLKRITFREPTTAETISAMAYKFEELFKRDVFDSWNLPNKNLYAGRISRVSDGVFVNPPRDEGGHIITDEKTLKAFLKGVEPVRVGKGHVYIVPNSENLKGFVRDFGFAEYESFRDGPQDFRVFAEGGLSRVLEHTEQPAENILKIVDPKNFSNGLTKVCIKQASSFDPFVVFDNSNKTEFAVWGDARYENHIGVIFGVLDGE
jgi:hypothetical protein